MIRRLLLAYYNRFAGCPIRPTRWQRWQKLARAWWKDNGLPVVMIANIVWLYLFWYGLLGMK